MSDLDRMIGEALAEDERALLKRIGEEPGYVAQAIGLFGGQLGWVNMVLMLAQAAAFLGGVWAAWHFFAAQEALTALRWGLPAAVLLLVSLIMKMALWPVLHSNRLMREMKRIELQIALQARGRGD